MDAYICGFIRIESPEFNTCIHIYIYICGCMYEDLKACAEIHKDSFDVLLHALLSPYDLKGSIRLSGSFLTT